MIFAIAAVLTSAASQAHLPAETKMVDATGSTRLLCVMKGACNNFNFALWKL
jgi:hypothetical protein